MAIKDIGLRIKVESVSDGSLKALDRHEKTLRLIQKDVDVLHKSTTKYQHEAEKGFHRLGGAATEFSRHLVTGVHSATSLLQRFGSAVDSIAGKLLNFKTIFTTGLIGAGVVGGLRKILAEGQGDILLASRIKREFGADAGFINAIGGKVAGRAGISESGGLQALIPIAQAINETQAGTRFQGRKLTAEQARRLRESTFTTGASLFERAATLIPNVDKEELGLKLAEAGTSAEGLSTLARSLGLNRKLVEKFAEANKRGRLADVVDKDLAKQLGIKRGQVAGQGTVLELIFQKAGLTEAAAKEQRGTFGYQVKSIGATLEDAFGQIGQSAVERLNMKLSEGGTLAEKFQKFLASPEGKRTLDQISSTIVSIVEGLASIAKKIPDIINFVKENKGLLVTLAGVYGTSKVAAPIVSTASGIAKVASAFGGGAGKLAAVGGGLLGGVGAVAATGAAAYFGARYLDNKFGISDKLAGGAQSLEKSREASTNELSIARKIFSRSDLSDAGKAAEFSRFAASAEGTQGISPFARYLKAQLASGAGGSLATTSIDSIMKMAGSGAGANINLTVMMDGHQVASRVIKRVEHNMSVQSADGAAQSSAY